MGRITLLSICLALVLLALVACGGGSIVITPPGGNPPPGGQSPQPNPSKIWAGFDGGNFVIRGEPGTVEPNATVHYEDVYSLRTSGPAGADGSFEISNMPPAFETSPTAPVSISQTAPGMSESGQVTVLISGP